MKKANDAHSGDSLCKESQNCETGDLYTALEMEFNLHLNTSITKNQNTGCQKRPNATSVILPVKKIMLPKMESTIGL